MSTPKTRHIQQFINHGGMRVVINTTAKVYHCRSVNSGFSEWAMLVAQVKRGIGAPFRGNMVQEHKASAAITVIMG